MNILKYQKTSLTLLTIVVVFFPKYSQAQSSLQEYFTLAAEQNPGLQAQYARFEAAMQQIDQVNSLEDPTLSFGYFISPVETRVGPQRARFSFNQKFPWFGTLKARGDVAALQAEAAYQTFIDARNQLYYQVAAAYYPLYELQQLIDIEQENIDLLQSYKQIATSQFENAKGPMADVLRVDLRLKESETEVEILKEKREMLFTTFNMLLDREPLAPVKIIDTLTMADFNEPGLTDSLFAGHPQLRELALQQKAMQAKERVAQLQGMPRLGFGLDYVLVDERAGTEMPDNGKDVLMPTVTVSIPIFRKQYQARQKEAQLMQEAYARQEQAARNSLTDSYQQTLFELYKNRQYIELYQEQTAQTQQVLNLMFSAYANDGQNFEELLRVQQQLLKYRRLLAEAIRQYQEQLAELDYILGKEKNS